MTFIANNTQSLDERPRSGTVIGLRNTTTAEIVALDAGRKRWLVGSSDASDIVVDDPYVSRMHCLIERRPSGTLTVRDQESRNGTFVEGNCVEMAELRVGSYISIGRTTLVAIAAPGDQRKRPALEQMLTCDPSLRRTIDQAVRAAQTDCSILVVGETGTGKDLLARIVHEASRRAGGPFVAVNCGAIPRELIGSE
ncbi:MAG TPA: FHA domain-containing protein, partial [Vicinamibacterales bacterium]|nr:FHA domain-containing protein [Vicinamibacterales bacterium]